MQLERKYLALLEEAYRREQADTGGLRLCFEILSLASAVDRDCADRLASHQLSEGRFVLLFLLSAATEGLSPHELSARAGVTRATVTGLLDGLARDGFVIRRPDTHDRRRIAVQLTAKGRAAADALFAVHTDWIDSLLDGLSDDERHQLSALLTRVWRNTAAGTAEVCQ